MSRAAGTLLVLALSLCAAPLASASFPGSNGPIAFQQLGSVWTVNPDGTGAQRLTDSTATRDPVFSPDGSRVAYEDGRDLVISTTGGSGTQPVTTGGHNDQMPAFSPDGKRIVFHRADDTDLYVVDVDGSDLTRLTSDGATSAEYEPDWSPDGSRIAFEQPGCDSGDGQVCIYSIGADGSGKVNLTPEQVPPDCPDVNPGVGPYGNSEDPTWSPDGRQIAFRGSSYHCQEGPSAGGDIWVMNADGSGKRDLILDGNNFNYDEQPSWSPDGTQIAFQSDRLNGGNNGPRDIVVMPAAGLAAGPATRVITPDDVDPQPSWAPAPSAIIGTLADDVLNGTEDDDVIRALAGNDVVNGLQNNDRISGGSGRDKLTGSEGNDVLRGGSGNDILAGATGHDRLVGGGGNDRLAGGQSKNKYSGGGGKDKINSANGVRETIVCGSGRDTVRVDRTDKVRGCERVKRAR